MGAHRLAVVIGLGLAGCGPRANAPTGAAPPATVAPVALELVAASPAPSFGRLVRIFHADDGLADEVAIALDDAGVARFAGGRVFAAATDRVLPFSEPVDDVVDLGQLAGQRTGADPQIGYLLCALTRSAAVECVHDVGATASRGRVTRRARLPFAGEVVHLGIYRPFGPSSVAGAVLCALVAQRPGAGPSTSCWGFSFDGSRAVPYTLDPPTAELAALGLAPELAAVWRARVPELTGAHLRRLVSSDRRDDARVIGPGASVAVQCGLLDSGRLVCVGPGVYGELGDGAATSAVRVSSPLGDAQVVDVAVRRHHVCAVLADGRVACWGALPDGLPLPPDHRPTPLPMCPLDRAASATRFDEERALNQREAADCARTCAGGEGLDRCLGCGERCTDVPYVFRHDALCQEPVGLDQSLAQRGDRCRSGGQPPSWLSDAELLGDTAVENLTLAPVFLPGIDDAVSVALPGRPSLCIVRRSGELTCPEAE